VSGQEDLATRGASLVRGNALTLPFGDETVDCIITSPPYFALRSYQDGGEHYDGQIGSEPTPTAFLEALWAVTAECWRVLKPTGSLFVNLGDKYAGTGGGNGQSGLSAKSTLKGNGHSGGGPKIRATPRAATDRFTMPTNNTKQTSGLVRAKSLMGLPWRYAIGCTDGQADPQGRGWVLRQEIVWSKPNGMPESVTDRVRRSHEQWFHLTKCGAYFADLDGIREPHRSEFRGLGPAGNSARAESAGDVHRGFGPEQSHHPLGALPPSVWRIATEPLIVPDWLDVDHFAAFPTEWPRRLITGWCPPDGVVLDPFGGTGTTAMVARALGRHGITMDLSADYLRLARWRIFESGQAAKVARRSAERTTDPAQAEQMATAAARLEQPDQGDIFALLAAEVSS